MKILHIGKFCPPNEGGIELFTYDLLDYLNSNGIKADLLCFGDKTEESIYRGFKYYSCRMNIKLNSAPFSMDLVKTFKAIEKEYDIIHVHSPNPLAEILSIFSSKKVIIHWHSDIVKQKISYRLYKPLQQMALKKATKIICTSPQYLETSDQLKKFKDKATIIPLGLDKRRLNSETKDEKVSEFLNKVRDKKIVLSVGRLVEAKGYKYLIQAGKYLGDDKVILIAGGGKLYNELKQQIIELGLENKIFLSGKIEINYVPYILNSCRVFCLSSINESFGLVLVEALYFGKPLITTDLKGSGMSYVNKSGETGLIVPPKNPKALADAINKILSDEQLYQTFSKNTLERFKEFEISSIVKKIIKLYNEILK